jgi:hypothetical protein
MGPFAFKFFAGTTDIDGVAKGWSDPKDARQEAVNTWMNFVFVVLTNLRVAVAHGRATAIFFADPRFCRPLIGAGRLRCDREKEIPESQQLPPLTPHQRQRLSTVSPLVKVISP